MTDAPEFLSTPPASAALPTDEAVKMWCPFVRELGDDGASYNRAYDGKIVGRCVAERCMAWRWADEDTDNGFCGIAGRPEVRA